MFEESFLEEGGVCSFKDEKVQVDDGGATALLTFRIEDPKAWGKLLVSMLEETESFSDFFGMTCRKEYFWDERVKFVWALYIWGAAQPDLGAAVNALKPYLGAPKRKKPVGKVRPDMAAHAVPDAAAKKGPVLRRSRFVDGKGKEVEQTVCALPHRQGNANRNVVDPAQRKVKLDLDGPMGEHTGLPRVHVDGMTSHSGGSPVSAEDEAL